MIKVLSIHHSQKTSILNFKTMLDLSKSYGRYEGLTFFGDHQDDHIVYYLPDEVALAQSGNGGYDFFLQLFHDNKMQNVSDNGSLSLSDSLENTSGSILQLSVNCMVSHERLDKAMTALKRDVTDLPGDAVATTPLWSDGSVDLITLDTSGKSEQTDPSDMVKAVVSSQRPSLTHDLKSVFNVRYDRLGTELIFSALQHERSMVAAVYDLQFAAIRPAVNLKITAWLKRCQETARKNIDANLHLSLEEVSVDFSAQVERLTQKMKENGDIVVEVTSEVTSDEEKKQVEELTNEFRNMVFRELFSPTVVSSGSLSMTDGGSEALLAEALSKAVDTITPVKIGLNYKLKEQTFSDDRMLQVDYSERSAIVRHHYPQAVLSDHFDTIADHLDDYTQKVIVGNLWMTQSVNVKLFHDFAAENSDLLSAEVMLWRHKEGVEEIVPDNHFALPVGTKPLADFVFSAMEEEKEGNVSWLCDDDDDGGYYYQIRFIYSGNAVGHYSPTEIVSQPILSYGRTVCVAPDSYMFYKEVPIMAGSVDFSVFEKVEVIVDVENADGVSLMTNQHFLLDEHCKETRYAVRGKDKSELSLWVSKIFYFKDKNNSPLKFPRYQLKDYAVIIDDPLIVKDITPIFLGSADAITKIILSYTITSPALSHPVSKTLHLNSTNENPVSITIYTTEDMVAYEITKVFRGDDGKMQTQKLLSEEKQATELSSIYIDLG